LSCTSGVGPRYNSGMPDVKAKPGAATTLSKVAIFSGLTESELTYLAQRSVSRQYSPGELVFSEGDPCAGMYVVESGHIRIFKSSANGREQVLNIVPGSRRFPSSNLSMDHSC
jgi:signal-transduction protein with cAMP-binding, CBS, and nucleotidyltransferase domain